MAHVIVVPMNLGDRVRSVREARGMSQEKLAQLAETSTRTIVRIEKGQVTPHPETLARIAKALGVVPDFFGLWTEVTRKLRRRTEMVA
jgi:transcriptional regulator with XRE-family HTH domain